MHRRMKSAWILGLLWVGIAPAILHATLAENATVTAQAGIGGYKTAIIDLPDGFAFYASSTPVILPPGADVTAVKLSPFANNADVVYFTSSTVVSAAAFDPSTSFAYYISSQAPSFIQTVQEGPAAPIGVLKSSITLQTGQDFIGTAVIDSTNHFAYLGTHTSTGVII